MSIENEVRIAYLQMIQAVITRMANNAFLIKGWSISISTAMLALAGATKNEFFCILTIVPLFLFWWLDAYFYHQEIKYRGLYDHAKGNSLKIDEVFSLDPNMLNSNKEECIVKILSRLQVMEKVSVYPIYIAQIILVLLSLILIKSL
ncbi:hypothetical protein [Photobacterium angustum]|uniref:hypothetical protein n=1 Tax=Photobacterium angustum TaxID=661 RepID=UPI0006997C5B|nr:hypothetical protein [Photobacterium angustum]PSV67030.1 hypothetical protein CTM95_10360 [Photobacterium angustum]